MLDQMGQPTGGALADASMSLISIELRFAVFNQCVEESRHTLVSCCLKNSDKVKLLSFLL